VNDHGKYVDGKVKLKKILSASNIFATKINFWLFFSFHVHDRQKSHHGENEWIGENIFGFLDLNANRFVEKNLKEF
jgi:hypothetical protein